MMTRAGCIVSSLRRQQAITSSASVTRRPLSVVVKHTAQYSTAVTAVSKELFDVFFLALSQVCNKKTKNYNAKSRNSEEEQEEKKKEKKKLYDCNREKQQKKPSFSLSCFFCINRLCSFLCLFLPL